MKKYIFGTIAGGLLSMAAVSCTDLEEKVFDRIDASIYYQDEASVQGAIASIYSAAASSFLEYFWYLNEFSADQIAWRVWNGGQWGYDEAEKYVLSTHTWNSESKIIRSAWEGAWTTIGLCNTLLSDLEGIDPGALKITQEKKDQYIAEVRTMRAWAYYNNFELWGGSLPLNVSVSSTVPGSVSADFNEGCQLIYDFISTELDESYQHMLIEDGSGNTKTRLNQAANRMLKMRLLLNSELFTGTAHYTECATLCEEIIAGQYGSYALADDYRDIFSENNNSCPELVFAFAQENGKKTNNNRNTPMLPYNYNEIFGSTLPQSGWNCVIVAPSKDNSGNVLPEGGTDNPRSFITDYGDKLGGVYDRMTDGDCRKAPFKYDEATGTWNGWFVMGAQYNYLTGEPVEADADRQGQQIVYVDQLGTFLNLGRQLETVMSPRWGETTSGYRLVKYPILPETTGVDWTNIDEVEFRLAEVYYTLAECRLRAGNSEEAKQLVNTVRKRYFSNTTALNNPGPGMTAFDEDWMLSEWGIEFLNESRRRRTDLRRFDKFTQGQWWFFGRTSETDRELPVKRDRKYEWFPIPQSALTVNPGLVQVPNY
ncbi:MAG: RagB/SusD family nutrient uptake outer membrane protein [Muribaculaceae bacterium]|nr:RagB/SusD family nutrient uptake outer membrane protein [Muribaculaceae bacterium]